MLKAARSFLKQYFELPQTDKNVVCMGGGVGTAQILKGLRNYSHNLTAIVSMADTGGSSGRLRRAFSVIPPGDLVNCLAALSDEESVIKELFLYRFKGKRYGPDTDLGGQKLGNLIFVALSDIYKGNTARALEEFSRIISSRGRVLPATLSYVDIWALTKGGRRVEGELDIDLGNYPNREKSLSEVHLNPASPKMYKPALDAIIEASTIIVGPGDLFSTILPTLIAPKVQKAIKASKATKIFVVNIANKPYETVGFKASDYARTIKEHLDADIFDYIIVNTNKAPVLPPELNYRYVENDLENLSKYKSKIIADDFVNRDFPVYHDSAKIARVIEKKTS